MTIYSASTLHVRDYRDGRNHMRADIDAAITKMMKDAKDEKAKAALAAAVMTIRNSR